MMMQKTIRMAGMAGLILLLASNSEAACFQNCLASVDATKPMTEKTDLQNSYNQNQNSFNREKSHDMTNSKNAILGDMNFRIGHERMEFSAGDNAQVNASITSIVNLGDAVSTGDTHNK